MMLGEKYLLCLLLLHHLVGSDGHEARAVTAHP